LLKPVTLRGVVVHVAAGCLVGLLVGIGCGSAFGAVLGLVAGMPTPRVSSSAAVLISAAWGAWFGAFLGLGVGAVLGILSVFTASTFVAAATGGGLVMFHAFAVLLATDLGTAAVLILVLLQSALGVLAALVVTLCLRSLVPRECALRPRPSNAA
jgi:hypothetical protein